jgi:hypothetical protein
MTRRTWPALLLLAAGPVGCFETLRPVGPFAEELQAVTGLPVEGRAPDKAKGKGDKSARAAKDKDKARGDDTARATKSKPKAEPKKAKKPADAPPPAPEVAPEDLTADNVYEKLQAVKAELAEAARPAPADDE